MKKKYGALKYVRFSIADYVFDMSLPLLGAGVFFFQDRKSTRLNSSHITRSRMRSSA